ncbi:MAG: hypothetical protein Q9159_007247 [Coniocarpon cinnabarinum]
MQQDALRYSVRSMMVPQEGLEGARISFMCRGVRFRIDIHFEDLHRTDDQFPGCLEGQVLSFRDNPAQGTDYTEDFEEWAVTPCLEYFRQHVPPHFDFNSFTLEQYFKPPMYYLKLVNVEGGLLAIEDENGPESHRNEPVERVFLTDLVISQVQLEGLGKFHPSEVYIVAEYGDRHPEECAFPLLVQPKRSTKQFFLKTLYEQSSFRREVETYAHLKSLSSYDTHTPKLVSLVVWEDGSILGFLLNYLKDSEILNQAARGAPLEARMKWMGQIERFVAELHDANLVWGDVKPANVLIDTHGDAHVIDFDGGWTEGWVDEAENETVAGDLTGLRRIREYLELL